MKKYIVITMHSADKLEAEVDQAITQGYNLLGGVSTTTIVEQGHPVVKYSQAMVLSTAANFVA